jgi:hypothetical protein
MKKFKAEDFYFKDIKYYCQEVDNIYNKMCNNYKRKWGDDELKQIIDLHKESTYYKLLLDIDSRILMEEIFDDLIKFANTQKNIIAWVNTF